ncbi:MAG: energy transducer TonB [Rudaea sp.]
MNIENSRRVLLAAAVVVVAIVVAVYFFSRQSGGTKPGPTIAAGLPGKPLPAAITATASPPQAATPVIPAGPTAADAATLTVPQLLNNAAKALSEERLVEPAGNNAVEYYLLVLERDKGNRSAQDGLREMFPLATSAVEQQINAGQLDASLRMINLLGKADPTNYTLTILRNKLDLKKRQVDHDQQKRDQDKRDQDKLLAAARNQPATPAPVSATPTATTSAAPAGANAAPASAGPVAAPVQKPAAQAAVVPAVAGTSSPAPAALGENRAATLVKKTAPNYPPDAARKHEEGWVEVGFTVDADGHVKDAAVVGASPARVFNDSALRAIEGWTFQPRLENGKPVEEHVKSRIEFKLGAG